MTFFFVLTFCFHFNRKINRTKTKGVHFSKLTHPTWLNGSTFFQASSSNIFLNIIIHLIVKVKTINMAIVAF
jgi:hypothetical protein